MDTIRQETIGDGNTVAGRDLTIIKIDGITKRPSSIAKVIANLSGHIVQGIPEQSASITKYDIETKISYNNLVKYRPLIDKYGSYGGVIEGICTSLDADKPNTKIRIFDYINTQYLKEKGELLKKGGDPIEVIKENSDNIIDRIYSHLLDFVKGSAELKDIDEEDVRMSVLSLVAVAFIDCNILERPVSK